MKPTKHSIYTAITKKIFHYRNKCNKNRIKQDESYICGLLESRTIIREHLKKGLL